MNIVSRSNRISYLNHINIMANFVRVIILIVYERSYCGPVKIKNSTAALIAKTLCAGRLLASFARRYDIISERTKQL